VLASHSSGRNAGIFRPLEATPGIAALAEGSRALLDQLVDRAWMRRTGGLFVASDPGWLHDLAEVARSADLPHRALDRRDLIALVPLLAGGEACCGLLAPTVGVIDIHEVVTRLAAAVRSAGAAIVAGRAVTRLRVRGGRVEGVELAGGDTIAAEQVVIAGGAWAAALGASGGAPLPLAPLRRHLAHLKPAQPPAEGSPVVWRLGDEVYFRGESGGLLASPCDEAPCAPGDPPVDPAALEVLAAKLSGLAPRLATARVRRAWACLRTFAPDRRPVAGRDPRVGGLFWLAGLGGCGMTIGVAAAAVVTALLRERDHPLAALVDPARLLEADRGSAAASRIA
jgi:D-arginine dehydrogenase